MLFEDKKPYVVAGLVASLTFGANLAALPTDALAQELDAALEPTVAEQVATSDTELATEGAVTSETAQAETPEAADTSEVTNAAEASDTADASEVVEPAEPDATTPETPEVVEPDQTDDVVVTPTISGVTTDSPAALVTTDGSATPSNASSQDIATIGAVDSTQTPDASKDEQSLAVDAVTNQWKNENGKYYYYDASGKKASGWVVTDKFYSNNSNIGLQRYWVDSSLGLIFNKLFNDGGWWAYATDKGYVVRGKYTASNGNVYLANDDGKLENAGWLVTGAYDGGALQRYYIDAKAHAAVEGYSSDGWAHYTTSSGYVLRGKLKVGNKTYLANNDGKLENAGWLVTGAYDGGTLQRYYIDANAHAAVEGLSMDGWAHYTTSNGYVLRNTKQKTGEGFVFANNDGLLISQKGWMVTGTYDGGTLQRYYLVDSTSNPGKYSVAKTGFFQAKLTSNAATSWFYGDTSKGYVVRGKQKLNGDIVLINNDGVISSQTGWVVTNAYDGGLQRYYLEATSTGYSKVKTGFFEAKLTNSSPTQKFYGDTSKGYVSWGKLKMSAGVLVANNDGVLLESLFSNASGWLVTNVFDGGLQRYYIIDNGGHKYARTGAFSVDGKKYYGREDQGYVVRGAYQAPDGKSYYGDNDGVLVEYGWYKDASGWYFLYIDGSTCRFTNAAKRAWDKVVGGNHTSSTNYYICVDKSNFRVVILKKFNGSWIPAKNCDWLCAVGSTRNETIEGFQKIISKGYSMSIDGIAHEYYWTQFNKPSYWRSNGQRFHSLVYVNGRVYSDGRGKKISNGCVRLTIQQSKVIYDYCPIGTTVWVYR